MALVKGQLRELLTNYGEMSIIWFDTGDRFAEINDGYGRLVRQLQPNCLISGRLGGSAGMSDYAQQGDRTIPPKRVIGDVETPMTLRDNWGYDRDESNWKSDKDILERLSLTVCRGANMLLNVGPRPDGTLCPQEIASLKAIGRWMSINSDAIYGSTASPFDYDFEWGSMSQKPGKLYLHVLMWNPNGIVVNGLKSKVKRAYLLADKSKNLPVDQTGAIVTVRVPAKAPDGNISVIALELDGQPVIDPDAKGTYHWVKGVDIKLNTEKIEKQRAEGWKANRKGK